jgi:hypothetical protein
MVMAPLDVLAENEPIVSMFALIVMPALATRLRELLTLLLIIGALIVIVPALALLRSLLPYEYH